MHTPETSEPHDLATPEYTAVNPALNVVSDHIGKWFAITAFATQPNTPLSFWQVADILDSAQGDNPAIALKSESTMSIRSFCDFSFANSGLLTSELSTNRMRAQTRSHRITENGMLAAAVAGVLMQVQLDHPDKNIPALFRLNTGRRDPHTTKPALEALTAIATRSMTDFVPISFIWAGGKVTTKYDAIEHLIGLGVLDSIHRGDKDLRTFEIVEPKIKYNVNEMSKEVRLAYAAAMSLRRPELTTVTGTRLLQEVAAIDPDADVEAVWKRLQFGAPAFLKAEWHPAFAKSTDKIAVRINAEHAEFVDQLLSSLKELAANPQAQEASRYYASYILTKRPAIVAYLIKLAYLPEDEPNPDPNHGKIPAPDYPGWHADWHAERWNPLSALQTKRRVATAAIARATHNV